MDTIDFIGTNQPLNSQEEFGNGYIRLTDSSFNKYTNHYKMESEILDESHNMMGELTIDSYICDFHEDDQNVNLKFFMEMDFKGDIEKIHSL